MHTMLWVLLVYVFIVILLLIVFFMAVSKQKKDKEKSLSDKLHSEQEQISSETDSMDVPAQIDEGANDAIVNTGTDSVEESTGEL